MEVDTGEKLLHLAFAEVDVLAEVDIPEDDNSAEVDGPKDDIPAEVCLFYQCSEVDTGETLLHLAVFAKVNVPAKVDILKVDIPAEVDGPKVDNTALS